MLLLSTLFIRLIRDQIENKMQQTEAKNRMASYLSRNYEAFVEKEQGKMIFRVAQDI